MFLTLNQSMKLVFELKLENSRNKQHVANVRSLTLNKNNPLGLQGKYGLYDSDEWWSNIESGILPNKIITGNIIRVYKAGQDSSDEFNSFELILDSGEKWSSGIYVNDNSDLELFKIGKKVSILYILEKLKTGEVIDLVVEMIIEIDLPQKVGQVS